MIKIRTITYSLPHHICDADLAQIRYVSDCWKNIKYECHTQRMAFPPQSPNFELSSFAWLSDFCDSTGIRWFNVPIDPWQSDALDSKLIVDLLSNYPNAFCNIICTKDKCIDDKIITYTIDAIKGVAKIEADGSSNFRLGASMNVSPNGPFFPFTYSDGEKLSFSIGLEIAEDVNDAVADCKDLQSTRIRINEVLEPQIQEIQDIAYEISEKTGVQYNGIDFSLAPLPKENSSVISILGSLGVQKMNGVGMMFGTAYLTDILKTYARKYKSVGFSGVMYSLLEDCEYAELNNNDVFSIDKMISLSTMCGCGVDMVPVKYDISDEAMRSIIIEIGCISSKLNKPLGVRILPICRSKHGYTDIKSDEDFIVNTKLVEIEHNSIFPLGENFRFVSV